MTSGSAGHLPEAARQAPAAGKEPPILLVEDEETLVDAIRYNLEREGYEVVALGEGGKALATFRELQPCLVVLDLMLPGISGLDLCRTIRSESPVPVIMVTAKDGEADRVAGLEIGADDYVTKPFSMRELVARIRAQLRRGAMGTSQSSKAPIAGGPVELDTERHEVRVRGALVDFPPKEFDLLEMLLSRPGRLVTRERLMSEVWGFDYHQDTRTLDVHMKRLRAKIEEHPRSPRYLKTVRGLGYKFEL